MRTDHSGRCIGGAWVCPGGPDAALRFITGAIEDCFAEEPLTCDEAQSLYTDATCTAHPSCTP